MGAGAEKSGAKICSKSEQVGIADGFPEQNFSHNRLDATPALCKISGQTVDSFSKSTERENPSQYPRGNIIVEFEQHAIL